MKNTSHRSCGLHVGDALDKTIRQSALYGYFRSYDVSEERLKNSLFYKLLHADKLSVTFTYLHNAFASLCEKSVIVSFFERLADTLLSCSVRSYAVVLIYSAIYACVMNLIGQTSMTPTILVQCLFFPLVILIVSLLFLPFRCSAAAFISRSRILSYIVFDILGTDEVQFSKYHDYVPTSGATILLGTLIGIVSYFVPARLLLIAFVLLCYVLLSFRSPENGLVCMTAALPLLSFQVLLAASVIVTAGYLFKTLRGKRNGTLHLFDLLILFIAFLFLFGAHGVTGDRSTIVDSLSLFILALPYFALSHGLRDESFCSRFGYTLSLSAFLSCIAGLISRIADLPVVLSFWDRMGFRLSYEVSHAFSDTIQLGNFLLLLFPFAMSSFIGGRDAVKRIGGLAASCAIGVYIVISMSKGLWLALFVCLLMYFVTTLKKPLVSILALLITTVSGFVFLTLSTFLGNDRFFNVNSYKSSILGVTEEIIRDYFPGGIGGGSNDFCRVFASYAHFGEYGPNNCYNFFYQFTVHYGVAASLFLAIVLLLFIKMCFSALSKESSLNVTPRLAVISSVSAMITICIRGFTSYIWADPRVFCLFFLILGYAAAASRIRTPTEEMFRLAKGDTYDGI